MTLNQDNEMQAHVLSLLNGFSARPAVERNGGIIVAFSLGCVTEFPFLPVMPTVKAGNREFMSRDL